MFSTTDFEGNTVYRLSVITMNLLHLNPIGQFHLLSPTMKQEYNIVMNKYIESLPDTDWNDKICNDFNIVVREKVLNQDISNFYVDELITNRNVLPQNKEECIPTK